MVNNVDPEPDYDNVRTGYSSAINLWSYEGTLIWNRFTAMVYSNTIITATLGLIITSQVASKLWFLTLGLSSVGLVLCICWHVLNRRGFAYYGYWIRAAKELEKYLPPVNTVRRGESFAAGDAVVFQFENRNEEYRIRGMAESMKVKTITNIVVVVFGLLYSLIGISVAL